MRAKDIEIGERYHISGRGIWTVLRPDPVIQPRSPRYYICKKEGATAIASISSRAFIGPVDPPVRGLKSMFRL